MIYFWGMGYLMLADGTVFEGVTTGSAVGEVIFISDTAACMQALQSPIAPSLIVVSTYPLLGHFDRAVEVGVGGLAVSELDMLVGGRPLRGSVRCLIEGLDTRAVSKHLRLYGNMVGAIGKNIEQLKSAIEGFAPPMAQGDARRVASGDRHATIIDLGITDELLATLAPLNLTLDVIAPDTPIGETDLLIVAGDGLGFDDEVFYQRLLDCTAPKLGLGSGCLALGLAHGFSCSRLLLGHHGIVSVMEKRGIIFDSFQLHQMVLIGEVKGCVLTHKCPLDGSIEGFFCRSSATHAFMFVPDSQTLCQLIEHKLRGK